MIPVIATHLVAFAIGMLLGPFVMNQIKKLIAKND